MIENLFDNIYNGKKVLVTGNTGFKGSWLTLWLLNLNAKVYGLSIDIPTDPSLYQVLGLEDKIEQYFIDINNINDLKITIEKINPDFIFHLAAQSIVAKSYTDPVKTFNTNISGTINLLESLRLLNQKCSVILISSDKCYENQEWEWSYRENDQLGGKDPYSASKGALELVIHSYYYSYFRNAESKIKIVSVRAGNVIGGGDWAEMRLIPDFMRAWQSNKILEIRNPNSIRPWQHVLEPLSGYLRVGQILYSDSSINGEAFNFGPSSDEAFTVLEMLDKLKIKREIENINYFINKSKSFHEAGMLRLSCDKALSRLQWKPVLNFYSTIEFTSNWYINYYAQNQDLYWFTINQLKEYVVNAKEKQLNWTIADHSSN